MSQSEGAGQATGAAASLEEQFPGAILARHAYRGDETVILKREFLLEVAAFLKSSDPFQFNLLVDVTAVDYSRFGKGPKPAFFASSGVSVAPSAQIQADPSPWPGPPEGGRFAVVYHFYSTTRKHRLRLVVPVEESDPVVDSLAGLWAAADWLERETWDMFGIRFTGHPNLKRILMYEEFEGHPLRKDYPVNKRQPLVGPKN